MSSLPFTRDVQLPKLAAVVVMVIRDRSILNTRHVTRRSLAIGQSDQWSVVVVVALVKMPRVTYCSCDLQSRTAAAAAAG